MTTTELPLGIDEAKPSSRVLRPPGGGSSFSLGDNPPAPQQLRQSASEASPAAATPPAKTVEPARTPDNPQAEGKPAACIPSNNSHARIFGDSDYPSPSRGRDLSKGASNPITGEKEKPVVAQVQSSGKVRQPPGGFSQGIF